MNEIEKKHGTQPLGYFIRYACMRLPNGHKIELSISNEDIDVVLLSQGFVPVEIGGDMRPSEKIIEAVQKARKRAGLWR